MNTRTHKNQRRSNKFLPIIDNWEEYFRHRDEGLGTTYERLMLHRIFSRINKKYEIKNILEIPSFGMTGISGINSMWWAKEGKDVTIVDNIHHRVALIKSLWKESGLTANIISATYGERKFDSESFDLVWNFTALWFLADLQSFLDQLKRISRKIVLICIPNNQNLFFKIRKLVLARGSNLNFRYIGKSQIKEMMNDHHWKLCEEGFFDIPPWPDVPVKKEVLLHQLKLNFLLRKTNSKSSTFGILDYLIGNEYELARRFEKWQFLENSPKLIQRIWAHHRFLLFEKM